ncbi:alpha/beta fold hydrolase [Conexibacter woesei]|uniref:Alpha/beta hydrolase fold protein n=1 Tax=Conexibacter woesei (strain DSM 14684 / CCUG 47730 / CIP 108061 / JCM 11494 / NBRC 100937 / ID131577) TaxID=469383 RepID=D3FDG2_CONWI|nr:alpha/beta hydrolase [Conexibacter woesei]ADB53554.1 alpha/beta hydrolase fold protein [Conexibacter woesei DSM 14684]
MLAARVRHRSTEVAGVRVFYREAGPDDSPLTLVLLHGFPGSSQMFRHVIEPLADLGVRVVAPDMPGFGLSSLPEPRGPYTFAWIADVVEEWLSGLGVTDKILYLHDYGSAVGYQLATRSPSTVRGLVVQNGNAHEEGLGKQWDASRDYWSDPTEENRRRIEPWLHYEGTKHQYLWALPERLAELVPPETWELDWRAISRGDGLDAHWELFTDYRTHVARFPEIARYHREAEPPTLIVWGVHDPYYDLDEVLAYHRVLPTAESHLLDAGHYLLETHSREFVSHARPFIARLIEQQGRS